MLYTTLPGVSGESRETERRLDLGVTASRRYFGNLTSKGRQSSFRFTSCRT